MEAFNCNFKGVDFDVTESSEERGLRVVTHEFPNKDEPFIESLGRRARKFNLKATVGGDDWASKRDNLISTFEESSAGTLLHPAYGEIYCYCESASLSEAYVTGRSYCTIDLVFVETQREQESVAKISTQSDIRASFASATSSLNDVFQTLYSVSNLPSLAGDWISEQITSIVGVNPYQILSVLDSAKSLLSTNPLDSLLLSTGITTFTGSFRASFIEWFASDDVDFKSYNQFTSPSFNNVSHPVTITKSGKTTSYCTPAQTIRALSLIKRSALTIPKVAGVTRDKVKLQNLNNHVAKLFVANCAIQQSVASTYINYNDIKQASAIWFEVISTFDSAIDLCATFGDNDSLNILKTEKARFQADMAARAPTLNRIVKKEQVYAKPAIFLVYSNYGNLAKYEDFISRNAVDHPCFVSGTIEYA